MRRSFTGIGDGRLNANGILCRLFLIETIIDGLAIAAGDTTLVAAAVPALLVKVKYVIALAMIPLLFKSGIGRKSACLCVLPVIYWAVSFFNERSGNMDPNVLMPLLLCLYCAMSDADKRCVFEKYRIYLVVISCLGIAACLSALLSLGIPFGVVPYYGSSDNAVYLDFTFSYIYVNGEIPRLCGLFNEPGYMGTVAALVLIADGCDLRRPGNVVIFIAGMFTLSLAFFVLVLLYFLARQIDRPVRLVVIMSGILFFLISVPDIRVDDPAVQHLIDRFNIRDGKLEGDNRTSVPFDIMYDKMYDDGKALFGLGTSALAGKNFDVASYKTYIVRFGIVGFLLLMGPLLLSALAFARRNMMALVFIMCFFASLYQRPYAYAPTYFVILFGGISYILHKQDSIAEGKAAMRFS